MGRKVKQHRMRQREGNSRYWYCVNDGCSEFLLDLQTPARKRIPGGLAFRSLGTPCPTKRDHGPRIAAHASRAQGPPAMT